MVPGIFWHDAFDQWFFILVFARSAQKPGGKNSTPGSSFKAETCLTEGTFYPPIFPQLPFIPFADSPDVHHVADNRLDT